MNIGAIKEIDTLLFLTDLGAAPHEEVDEARVARGSSHRQRENAFAVHFLNSEL